MGTARVGINSDRVGQAVFLSLSLTVCLSLSLYDFYPSQPHCPSVSSLSPVSSYPYRYLRTPALSRLILTMLRYLWVMPVLCFTFQLCAAWTLQKFAYRLRHGPLDKR